MNFPPSFTALLAIFIIIYGLQFFGARSDITGAETSIRHALNIDDTFAESHGVLALIKIMKGELEMAKDSIRRALGLNPQSFSGLYARAFLLKQQGRTESSEKLIQGMLDVSLMPDQTTLREILVKQMGKAN